MDARDIARVLTKAAAFDQRTVGEGDILAWLEAIGDLDLDVALAAVTRHYRESTDFLRPAHLRTQVDEVYRDRRRAARELADQARRPMLEAADALRHHTEDRSADVDQLVAHLRDWLGDYDRNALRRAEWVEWERRQDRDCRAEPNPHYTGPPPPGGWPVPHDPSAELRAATPDVPTPPAEEPADDQ